MTYALSIDTPLFERELLSALSPVVELAAVHHLSLVVDAPRGHAWQALSASSSAAVRRALVVTDSANAEYLEDLWDLGPCLLASNVRSVDELLLLVRRVVSEGRVRWTPLRPTELTPAERRVLRLVAAGHSNKEIARALDLSERTVHNALTRVFEKLALEGRTHAALQYWGLAQPLLARREGAERTA